MNSGKLCSECVSASAGMDNVTFELQDHDRAADGRFLCPFHRRYVGDV